MTSKMSAPTEQQENSDGLWYESLSEPRPLFVVISGPSGVGKDATLGLMRESSHLCHFVVTVTTREPRPGEVDGVDYHFVSEREFARLIKAGEMLEHAEVYGQRKGIRRTDIREALQSGKDVVIRVDVQGAETLRRLVPQAVTIFLTAESESALTDRLRRRKSDSADQIEERIRKAREELAQIDLFKYRVVNRECSLDETTETIFAIMRAEKCRVSWQPVVL